MRFTPSFGFAGLVAIGLLARPANLNLGVNQTSSLDATPPEPEPSRHLGQVLGSCSRCNSSVASPLLGFPASNQTCNQIVTLETLTSTPKAWFTVPMTETSQSSPITCSGTVYAVNPDDPTEGVDIHHDGPCPLHPDAEVQSDA